MLLSACGNEAEPAIARDAERICRSLIAAKSWPNQAPATGSRQLSKFRFSNEVYYSTIKTYLHRVRNGGSHLSHAMVVRIATGYSQGATTETAIRKLELSATRTRTKVTDPCHSASQQGRAKPDKWYGTDIKVPRTGREACYSHAARGHSLINSP